MAADLCPTLRAGGNSTGGDRPPGTDVDTMESLIVQPVTYSIMPQNSSRDYKAREVAVAFALRGRENGAVPEVEGDGSKVGALRAASGGSSRDYVAFSPDVAATLVGRSSRGGGQTNSPGHNADQQIVATAAAVRRLTPVECCRLQGVPDSYFSPVLHRGKPLADGPIYKMLGNGWSIPVIRWIGERIAAEAALASGIREAA